MHKTLEKLNPFLYNSKCWNAQFQRGLVIQTRMGKTLELISFKDKSSLLYRASTPSGWMPTNEAMPHELGYLHTSIDYHIHPPNLGGLFLACLTKLGGRMEKLDAIALKQRDERIWQKYTYDADENNFKEVYLQGAFLGMYEQLVRILHRNTKNISQDFKDCDFFKLALVTYVDMYCKILVQPEFPEGAEDVAHIAISEYYNKDYEVIATLPQVPLDPNETDKGSWVRYIRYELVIFNIHNLALLQVMNSYHFNFTGKLGRFSPALEYKESMF